MALGGGRQNTHERDQLVPVGDVDIKLVVSESHGGSEHGRKPFNLLSEFATICPGRFGFLCRFNDSVSEQDGKRKLILKRFFIFEVSHKRTQKQNSTDCRAERSTWEFSLSRDRGTETSEEILIQRRVLLVLHHTLTACRQG